MSFLCVCEFVMHFWFGLSRTTNGFPVAGALHVEGGSGGVTLLRVGGGVLVLKKQPLGRKTTVTDAQHFHHE